MNSFKRFMSALLVVAITMAGLPMNAHAALVSTDEVVTAEAAAASREKVNAFLAREDVRKALMAEGVAQDAVQARVQAMTDAEVVQLAGQVDRAPAGGDVLGILFTVFIILLITDIMGLTKVFPFTRSVKH